ncbi:hypothetical protein P4O66_006865, partial [Electrophorus voltai]
MHPRVSDGPKDTSTEAAGLAGTHRIVGNILDGPERGRKSAFLPRLGWSSRWEVPGPPCLLSEKISGAEGTKLDEDFMEMERKIDVTNKSVFELITKTTEYLQPNPGRNGLYLSLNSLRGAKLGMLNTMSKIRGQVKTTGYPQTEGLLGDCMLRYGRELGDDSTFGTAQCSHTCLHIRVARHQVLGYALVDVGEAMKQMADVKDSLDINVKQNFIDPLQTLQDKDLKEIGHHLKKLEGRRLDFDYKKKRQGKIPDEEIKQAVEKFEESKELAERSMFNFLENDVEQVSQLTALIEAAVEYHRQSSEILEELSGKLQSRIATASSQPRREFKPKSIMSSLETISSTQHNGFSYSSSIKSSGGSSDAAISSSGPGGVAVTFKGESRRSRGVAAPVRGGFRRSRDTAAAVSGSSSGGVVVAVSGSSSRRSGGAAAPVSGAAGRSWGAPTETEPHMDQPCCRSLYDFEPENEGELGFKEGDIIILTNQIDENWYEGMINGESGFFPINYVEVL